MKSRWRGNEEEVRQQTGMRGETHHHKKRSEAEQSRRVGTARGVCGLSGNDSHFRFYP
jgi:hypothetical protein